MHHVLVFTGISLLKLKFDQAILFGTDPDWNGALEETPRS
jgi:hypothetical protein